MAQQPHVVIGRAERPDPETEPPAPEPWAPYRSGDMPGAERSSGAFFGRPGPDAGYALRLVGAADLPASPRKGLLERVLGTIASARAAAFGRGPIMQDVDVALGLLGFGADADEDALAERLDAILDSAVHEHTKGSGFVDTLPEPVLMGDAASARIHAARALRRS